MGWREEYEARLISPGEAAQLVQRGHTLYTPIGGDAYAVMPALIARISELDREVRIRACAPSPEQQWFKDEFAALGFDVNLEVYAGPGGRAALESLRADYYPQLFSTQFSHYDDRGSHEPIDVFMSTCAPPDDEGYIHFGGVPWHKGDFVRRANVSVLEVCPWLPNVRTTERLHVTEVSAFVLTETAERPPPPARDYQPEGPTIAGFVNELIEDGDTVQLGAGRTSIFLGDLGAFDGKRDIGWHSEVTPHAVLELMMEGTVNSSRKSLEPGLHVTTSVSPWNDEEACWLEHGPVETRAVSEVNQIQVVAQQRRMTSINNALSVDLTGQICAESLGTTVYHGTGGQPEFHIGAFIAPQGKAITVLPSTARGGEQSRIVAQVADGSYVTIPRSFADHVVTEHGVARLAGKSQRQRAEELIAIAHPDFRGELRAAALRQYYPAGREAPPSRDSQAGGA